MKSKNLTEFSVIFGLTSFLIFSIILLNKPFLVRAESQSQTENEDESANGTTENITVIFDPVDLEEDLQKTGHELTVVEEHDGSRKLECRGERIKSLKILKCETFQECQEKMNCLRDATNCSVTTRNRIVDGRDCSHRLSAYDTYYSRISFVGYGGSSCFHVSLPKYNYELSHGLVRCISKRTDAEYTADEEADDDKESEKDVATTDYFYMGHSPDESLLSKVGKSPKDQIKLHLSVENIRLDLTELAKGRPVPLWTNEEIELLDCKFPRFLFKHNNVTLSLHRKDGSTIQLNPEFTTNVTWERLISIHLENFRVTPDVIGFSCSVQRSDSAEWVTNWLNVTVHDPPSSTVVKSECREYTSPTFNISLTEGSVVKLRCELTGERNVKTNLTSVFRKMIYSYDRETQIDSVIGFLRFRDLAKNFYFCQNLLTNYSVPNVTVPADDDDGSYYSGSYDQLVYQFNVDFAPSRSKIHKPRKGPKFVKLWDQDETVVEATLLCNFKGEPKPAITWMKNGKELITKRPITTIKLPGNVTMEQMQLKIGALKPEDFDSSGHLNYSCLAKNFFGDDRLDFIIKLDDSPSDVVEKGEPEKTTPRAETTTKTTPTFTTTKTVETTTKKPILSTLKTTTAAPSTLNPAKTTVSTLLLLPSSASNRPDKVVWKSAGSAPSAALLIGILLITILLLAIGLFIMWKRRYSARRPLSASPTGGRVPIPRPRPRGIGIDLTPANQHIDPAYNVLLEDSGNP